jgi:hypothetical protein
MKTKQIDIFIAVVITFNFTLVPFLIGYLKCSTFFGFQYFIYGSLGLPLVFCRVNLLKINKYLRNNKDRPALLSKRLSDEKPYISVEQIKIKHNEISGIETKLKQYEQEAYRLNYYTNFMLILIGIGVFLIFLIK